jgi:P-type Cu+ transporter
MNGSNSNAGVTETRDIGVAGMTCDRCAQRVDRILRGVPGITGVNVSRGKSQATITFKPAITRLAAVHEALLQGGYTPTTTLSNAGEQS